MNHQPKIKRLVQVIAICTLSLVVTPANASTYAGESSGGEVSTSSQRVPNPAPGVQPAPQPMIESSGFSAGNIVERAAEVVSVAIANRDFNSWITRCTTRINFQYRWVWPDNSNNHDGYSE